VLLLAPAACAFAQAPPPDAAVRAEFRAALERAAQAGTADSAALRAYVLYPYVEAARLRHELARVPARQRPVALEQRVRALLGRHGDEPVTHELRRDWLAYLGARAAWADYERDAPEQLPTLELRCHALTARLARKRMDGLREAALDLWLTQSQAPPACAPAFKWLDARAHLTDAEIEQRALLAARARVPLPAALAALPPARAALMRWWHRLLAQPERELQRYAAGDRPEGLPPLPDSEVAEALLEAFTQVARRDSRRAQGLYDALKPLPYTAEQRAHLAREHALGLAYDRDARAVALFREVPESALDAVSREWRVRAALWHRDWAAAERWLEAMPPGQRAEPRWRYWQARLVERRQPEPARPLYEVVAREREYYAFLAAERLGRKPDLRPQPLAADAALQKALATDPAMRRAAELVRCQQQALAWAELRHALRGRGDAGKAQAAMQAAEWGWFEAAVKLVSEAQHWDDLDLRFPLPYGDQVQSAAKDASLPDDWVYAVLRTESLYDPRAVSRVGALGLLQLMPSTARQVAQRSGQAPPQREDLFRPEVNIPLGARYLGELLERFGRNFVLTLAAYNAGPNRVPQWLPEAPVAADVWIENIPYNETRSYVQRTLASLVILSWRRSGEPAALMPLLQPVAAPAAQAALP
jgi:soluble lytic murein transglycosylase